MLDKLNFRVFDVEGDGLKPSLLHVLSWKDNRGDVQSTFSYDKMKSLLTDTNMILIGHNITQWDVPNVERLLGIKIKARLIDTLALSWYLYHDKNRHGLEDWGENLGVPKPKIEDWYNLSKQEYQNRCEKDVEINYKLWVKMYGDLVALYGSWEKADRLVKYLQFKLDCARKQEHSRWKIDLGKAKKHLSELEKEKGEQPRKYNPENSNNSPKNNSQAQKENNYKQ